MGWCFVCVCVCLFLGARERPESLIYCISPLSRFIVFRMLSHWEGLQCIKSQTPFSFQMGIRLSHNAMPEDNYPDIINPRIHPHVWARQGKRRLKSQTGMNIGWNLTASVSIWCQSDHKGSYFVMPVCQFMNRWFLCSHGIRCSSCRVPFQVDAFRLISPGVILVGKTGTQAHTSPLVQLKTPLKQGQV